MSTPALSWRLTPPWLPGYAIAVLSVAAAVVADIAFNRSLGTDPTVSLFLCAIMFVAWAGGTGPSLLATALAILAFDYFFLHPAYSFALHLKETPRLALFSVPALI